MSTENTGDAAAIIDFAKTTTEPRVLQVSTPWGNDEQVIITTGSDGGAEVQPVRHLFAGLQPAPVRRVGTIETHDLASFVAATNRDKRDESIIFADVPRRALTAVLDFHAPGGDEPGWKEDRVTYNFKLSSQLTAWAQAEKSGPMDQKTFSRFIDDRLGDIDDAGPPEGSIAAEFAKRRGIALARTVDLVCFTRTVAAKSVTDSEELFDENTGSSSIQFKKRNDVKTPDGQPVPVPAAFALRVPVLNGIGATEYIIPVRLRFDIEGGRIVWRVELHALDKYLEAAIKEAVETVRKPAPDGCGLPVLMAAAP